MTNDQVLVQRTITFVTEMFDGKVRKNLQKTPYVAHLFEVMYLTMLASNNPAVHIAALLHDALEDIVDAEKSIFQEFATNGVLPQLLQEALELAKECSEKKNPADPGNKKASWRTRKEEHLLRIRDCSNDALLIIIADKVSNIQSEIQGIKTGTQNINAFNSSAGDRIWYTSSIIEIVDERDLDSKVKMLRDHLSELLDEFKKLI